MHERRERRFWLTHAVCPFLLFAILAVLFETTSLDFILSDPFYDRAQNLWPYRDSWWSRGLIHDVGKRIVLVIALGALAVAGLSARVARLRVWRRPALYLCLCIGLGTGLVAIGKATTNRHCPWDYDRYGGMVPHTSLLAPTPEGCSRGVCFPAGHASGGFSLLGGYFALRDRNRRWAGGGLAAGIGTGVLFGFGQVARGAHFASHVLWSAAVCWFAALMLYYLFRRRLTTGGLSAYENPAH